MKEYPVNLYIEGRKCLVVGGGAVGCRKAGQLLAAGARVRLVSPECCAAVSQLQGDLELVPRRFMAADLADCVLAVAASDDEALNHEVAVAARAANILVNVVDTPADCDFAVPAQLRRGDLLLTVATGGRSPALAAAIRRELAASYGPEFAAYLDTFALWRAAVRSRLPAAADRTALWHQTASAALALLRQGRTAAAGKLLENALGCQTGLSETYIRTPGSRGDDSNEDAADNRHTRQ